MSRNQNDINVSDDMVASGVSELITFDPEDGFYQDVATRIYRAMEKTRIDLLGNLQESHAREKSAQQ